jgi:hypothetical protein
MPWQPTIIRRADLSLATAAETVQVTTDAGKGYLKALGNRGGPHRLAADWTGTQLAAWLGLSTFEFAIIQVQPENEIPFQKGGQAQPGPAFITRLEPGMTWGGDPGILSSLVNPQDIAALVLFDTWVRNVDRYPPNPATRNPNRGNVFLSTKGLPDGQWRLLAMDHTHCFDGPGYLNARLSHIDLVKDDQLYGLFPEFKPFIRPHWPALLAAISKLQTIDRQWVDALVAGIPAEWAVDQVGRDALANQVYNRADYVAGTFVALIEPKIE